MIDLGAAKAALADGAVVGVPTDTVYGVAVSPWSEDAVVRLFRLKGRSGVKPIPILVASIEQAERVAIIDSRVSEAVAAHWPGPLTVIAERADGIPDWVGDPVRDSVGVRVPDHPVALALLEAAGPLAVTSANRSGEDPATDHEGARLALGDGVAVYLEGVSRGNVASTVVDLTGPEPRVLRSGPVVWEGG